MTRELEVSGRFLFSAVFAALALLAVGNDSLAGEPKVYKSVPSAEEMARVLTGRKIGGGSEGSGIRWRSIKMKDQVDSGGSSTVNPGVIAFKVHFDIDSAQIHPTDYQFLDEIGRMMQLPEMQGQFLVIEGHTDARGDDRYNWSLSQRRADAVVSYLNARHKVGVDRMRPIGRGESELLDFQDPMNGLNRRVQFYLPGAK